MKKILAISMTILTLLSINVIGTLEAAALSEETTQLDISKTAEASDTAHQYDITFTLPTQTRVEPETVDLVFVLDTTTISSYASVRQQINSFLDSLNEQDNLIVNVGVVSFNLNATNKLNGTLELNDANMAVIKNAFSSNTTAGSNMYGGLLLGKNILDAGTADNKYLVLASDFGGYKSDTGNGTGLSSFYLDGSIIGNKTDNSDFNSKYYYTQSANSEAAVFTPSAVSNLIDNKVFFNGTTASIATEPYLTQTGSSVGEYQDMWRYTFMHTFTAAEKATMPTWTFTQQAAWPTMFEKNIYLSGNLLKEMQVSGYHVSAVTTPYQPQTGSGGETYKLKFNYASESFKVWFEQNIGARYETTEGETFSDMLDDIENELVYLLGKGEIVDTVHPDFAIVQAIEPRVVVNGEPLTSTNLGDNTFGFGESEAGVYPYQYTKTSDSNGNETVVWSLNKAAKKDDLLQFTFTVELKNLPSQPGIYDYQTNTSAIINYIDSVEAKNGVSEYTKWQSMDSPTVQEIRAGIIIKHVDEKGNKLAEDTMLVDDIGKSYLAHPLAIDGYSFKMIDTNGAAEQGTFSDQIQIVTYIYTKVETEANTSTINTNNSLPATGQYRNELIGLGGILTISGILVLGYKKLK